MKICRLNQTIEKSTKFAHFRRPHDFSNVELNEQKSFLVIELPEVPKFSGKVKGCIIVENI